MKNFKIISIVLFFSFGVLALVANNISQTRKNRTFSVLLFKGEAFCFLADNALFIQKTKDGFIYTAGKNSGHIKILNRDLSIKMSRAKINGFEAAYAKSKNTRMFEYRITKNRVIRDDFFFISNSSLNLVPYRDDCEKIKTKFEKHI